MDAAETPEAAAAADDGTGPRILVIDDDPEMRLLLEVALSAFGTVETAEDGLVGLELYRNALRGSRPYALVCCDVQMPGMDGHQTVLALRRAESHVSANQPSRILMLTALSDRSHVQRAIAVGCDSYLVKPFGPDQLAERVRALGMVEQQAA